MVFASAPGGHVIPALTLGRRMRDLIVIALTSTSGAKLPAPPFERRRCANLHES